MRPVALGLIALACVPRAEPHPERDAPLRPFLPTALQLRDGRQSAQGLELRASLQAHADRELRRLGVPEGHDGAVVMQIDLVEVSTVWGDGAPRSCARFSGRVVRAGQAFVSMETPSERCTGDERYAAFQDLAVLAELNDPRHAPTPQGQLLREALDPLVAQLSNRCR